MKKQPFYLLLIFILFSCCKDDIPNPNPIVGDWTVAQVDSGSSPSDPRKWFTSHGLLNYTGTFEFREDSFGCLKGTILNISGNQSKFIWDYDASFPKTKVIDFAFLNGTTFAWVGSVNSDSLDFYFKYYFYQSMGGVAYYYHIQLVNKSSSK
jgi:hypothetical protein